MFEGYKKYITLTCWTASAVCFYFYFENGGTFGELLVDAINFLAIIGANL